MNFCRNKLKEERENERKWQNRGEDEAKKKEMRWEEMKEEKAHEREYIPTNRETCARVFSYVRCVVASRRFRVLYCEASQCNTTRRIVSFARSFWRTRLNYLRIEQLNDWLCFLLFFFLLLRLSHRFRRLKEDCENEEPCRDPDTNIESTIY